MSYLDQIDPKVKEYFQVLETHFPTWLEEYINTPVMLKQQYIGVSCGVIYSNLFKGNIFYSSLDHSIAVALIIWHFTKDKKQTLSGLFHDIATPVFKHSIDFLNGDYMTQESTEDLTKQIIKDSKEIMNLLERDNISLEEVEDYHIYPIADNDTPHLSSDRLEYSLSNAFIVHQLIDLSEVKEMYEDIVVGEDEEGNIELSFQTKKIARKFVKITSHLSVIYREDRTRYSMQFLADIVKHLVEEKLLKIEDLYHLKEEEVLDIIEKSKYHEIFQTWKKAEKVKVSKEKPNDSYYVHHGAKIRYIDPLVKGERISKICKIAHKMIEKNLSYDMDSYVYLEDISFEKI